MWSPHAQRVTYIEDNPADVRLCREALAGLPREVRLQVHPDGEQALESLSGRWPGGEPLPDLILLDLNLPRTSGLEILAQLRGRSETRFTPVVALTSSSSEKDIETFLQAGGNSYVLKRPDLQEHLAVVREVCEYWWNVSVRSSRI